MRPGAKWSVIVPPELGYPLPGYYPFKRPGEPHFHVSPNTLLIYDVEIIGQEA
jgi:FKBP-type peptidyl-prolyl cis-trans isomerase|tara:strand:+ start:1406 stop:1564 length:159 start_codon:yes stop_codon:yes gene_type:complete